MKHVCCFCKTEIIRDHRDPLVLQVRSMGNKIEYNDGAQEFFSHVKCLYKAIHRDVVFMWYDEDLEN